MKPITVDTTDEAHCNVRCITHAPHTYCSGYPKCVAGYAHRIRALFDHRHASREVVFVTKKRSPLGGHARTRFTIDPVSKSTIEEVELHCESLKFESLLKKDATAEGKIPPESGSSLQ